MLYSDINSCVTLDHATCSIFNVERGIRQGCNSSPLLFIMVAELMSIKIKNNGTEGILDKQIVVSQFADYSTLFLKNESQIPKVLDSIDHFTKVAGLKLNIDKC